MLSKRIDRKLVLAFFASAWTLVAFPGVECIASEVRDISYDDDWYYKGEVELRPDFAVTCRSGGLCAEYCSDGYCAHGNGSLGTDGSVDYTGTFVHGRLEGSGSLVDDSFKYVGGFNHGMFDGHGELTCYSYPGRQFKGTFVQGKLIGESEVARPSEGETAQTPNDLLNYWRHQC